MFLGHFAVGFAGKRFAPEVSLGVLFLAVQLADVVWPVFLLAGLEHVRIDPGNTPVTPLDFYDYPWSHSMVADLAWAAVFAGVFWLLRRDVRTSLLLGAGVFSHWVLDVISHRPDMPVLPHGPYVGLGLWYSQPSTIAVELAMFVAGVMIYLRTGKAKDSVGRYATGSLIAFLVAAYFMNLFGPPPPNVQMIAIVGNASWLILAWAVWTDRHRSAQPGE